MLQLYSGTMDAVRSIIRDEGWRALYSGLASALVGSGMAWGLYFFAYNHAKQRYQRNEGQQRLSPALNLLSAAEAGFFTTFATNPIWVAKTRLQLQRNGVTAPGQYSGFLHCLVQISTKEGVAGLYKGLLPSLLLVSHGAIQFAVYEELKSLAQSFSKQQQSGGPQQRHKGRTLSPAEVTAFGALSKLAASLATYPSQVVRSRLQQRMDTRMLQYRGLADVVRKTMAREGVRGFYRGLVPNMLRVMPQSALTFLVYESVMRQLDKWILAPQALPHTPPSSGAAGQQSRGE